MMTCKVSRQMANVSPRGATLDCLRVATYVRTTHAPKVEAKTTRASVKYEQTLASK